MSDIFTPEERQKIMSSIKSKNTKLEKIVFADLRKNKIYFQKHYFKVPGKPDIALPRKKRAVFIHSSFWHGKNIDKLRPKLNEYWIKRIEQNKKRDQAVYKQLEVRGWQILIVWDSELVPKNKREDTLMLIKQFLEN